MTGLFLILAQNFCEIEHYCSYNSIIILVSSPYESKNAQLLVLHYYDVQVSHTHTNVIKQHNPHKLRDKRKENRGRSTEQQDQDQEEALEQEENNK